MVDWIRTSAILRASPIPPPECLTSDPVREHALKESCSTIDHWGGASFTFFTNNLGFRDERVRSVAAVSSRPRVLILGDSFTQGADSWERSYVGILASRFPQYEFLNGGVSSYSPSNYLNVARMLLARGIHFDEVIVFIDISDVQDEAAFYHDVDASGAVGRPQENGRALKGLQYTRAARWRNFIAQHLFLTNHLVGFVQKTLVRLGYYHLTTGLLGDIFDLERSAWTYRQVNESEGFYPSQSGYGPLGVQGGIAREESKMTTLWQELAARGIPISVVVYPWPAQLAHDTVDSRQVEVWKDWCQGKCRRFISLFPAFFAVKNRCPGYAPGCWYPKYFLFGDVHYNVRGNIIVVNEVGRALETVPVTQVRPVSHPVLPPGV